MSDHDKTLGRLRDWIRWRSRDEKHRMFSWGDIDAAIRALLEERALDDNERKQDGETIGQLKARIDAALAECASSTPSLREICRALRGEK